MISQKLLPDGSRLLATQDGACQMRHFGRGTVLHTCKGVITVDFAAAVIADGEQQVNMHGRCIYMVDALDSPKMTGEFRDQVLRWMIKNEDRVDVHLLVDSPITKMLISVANFALRRKSVKVYSSVDAWETAGKEQYLAFRRRPIQSSLLGAPSPSPP